MKRFKMITIVIVILVFSFVIVSDVKATCTNVYEALIDPQSYEDNKGGVDPGSYKLEYFTKLKGEKNIVQLAKDQSACGIMEFGEFYRAVKKICKEDDQLDIINCKDDEVCTYKNSVATCINYKGNDGCDTPDEIKNVPYLGGGTISWSKFAHENDEACIGGNRNKCDTFSGSWNQIEDCVSANKPCVMSGTKPMVTWCGSACENPKGSLKDRHCSDDGNKVLICGDSGWDEVSLRLAFGDENCQECIPGVDGEISCLKDGDLICSKIEGKELDRRFPGSYICNGTFLYFCDSGYEKFNEGYFKPVENCALRDDDLKWCGNSEDDKTLRCVNESDYLGYQERIQETITSTTSIYNPLCDGDTGINTAFGCIPFEASGFAPKLLQIIFGIAGGIAFLLMVYGFILMATSSGDEKKLQAAKETITSAVTGLLVSIFALLLFRLIVVNILKIPGL